MNNCGPAALSMLFSYYGVFRTQDELGLKLRSSKDDPSVLLSQLEQEAKANGFYTRMLEGGSVPLLRLLVSKGFPVMVKIWIIENAAMQYGHSLIVSGFKGEDTIFLTDSLHGINVPMSVAKFDALWRVFNRSLLVIAHKGNEAASLDAVLTGTARDFAREAVKTALEEINLGYQHASLYAGATDSLVIGYCNLGSSYAKLEAWDKADAALSKAFEIGMLSRMLFYFPDYLLPWLMNGKYKRVLAEIKPYLQKNPFSEELQWYKQYAQAALKSER